MIKRNVLSGFLLSAFFVVLLPSMASAAPTESMSGNVSATSTYIWRGLAQTTDAAVQGGIQADFPQNIYAGAWTSTVDAGGKGGSEVDLYGGYKGKADLFGYDAGAIFYLYPNEYRRFNGQKADLSFLELYVDLSRDFYGAKLSISSDAGTYLEGYATIPLEAWNLGLHIGRYAIDKDYHGFIDSGIQKNYFDFKVGVSKDVGGFDVEFALTDNNLSGDIGEFRTAVTVSKGFTP